MQIITAFRKAGYEVSFSMPLSGHLQRQNLNRVLHLLSPDDIWNCENFFDPDVVLYRTQPDIVIFCNVNTFRTVKRRDKKIINIIDFYGPLQFEALLLDRVDGKAALRDGGELEARCRDLVEKLRDVDYIVTVSENQKYFWSAYCSLAGFSFSDLNVLVCPVSFEVPESVRRTATNMTVVYSGGFYPWQDPSRALRVAAKALDKIPEAKLHIFGGPHAGHPNEAEVKKLLDELQSYLCVEYHGYRPVEELIASLSTAWCALELMDQNIERELAITGRTVEFLSTGTPVIYNDYSTLSKLIREYNAGWTISPRDDGALEEVLQKLRDGGQSLVEQLSVNAKRLAEESFNARSSMAAVVTLCENGLQKRVSISNEHVERVRPCRILAIAHDSFALLDLRVNNPLRALHRKSLIEGFTTTGITFDRLLNDPSQYDVVLIQRAVPAYIYRTLHNLAIPFILDVDDNLLARAAYRTVASTETALLTGLSYATVVTAPTPRLIGLLEKYTGISISRKSFITPNGLPYPLEVRPRTVPTRLLWIQSDIAAMTTSRKAVVRAVENFSVKHDLPVVLIGPNVIDRPQFKNQVVMGQIDFSANLQLLEFGSTSIGVSPLETAADQETLDFIAGKSDLKMLLFDGYGHPGVYSDAPPYGDSPFRTGARLTDNSYEAWSESLEYQYREGWQRVGGTFQMDSGRAPY